MIVLFQFQKYCYLILYVFGYSFLSKAQDIKVKKQLIIPELTEGDMPSI